jgi:hypothetical protein
VEVLVIVVCKCSICQEVTTKWDMCSRCSAAYDRWQNSSANKGDAYSLIVWVARRARRFAKKGPHNGK